MGIRAADSVSNMTLTIRGRGILDRVEQEREGRIIFYFHSKRAKGRTVISISNFPISGVEIGGTHIKFEVPGGPLPPVKLLRHAHAHQQNQCNKRHHIKKKGDSLTYLSITTGDKKACNEESSVGNLHGR